MINKVRGTQDLLDLKLTNYIIDQAKKHFVNYNFTQIQTPILEHTKLFSRSLGETTDVVSKEMYVFSAEQEEDSICLRPEATASCIRAFIENSVQEKPYKIFTYGSMFRRERPQKGRWREFTQFNLEIINTESIKQDALFIKSLDSLFLNIFKLEDYVLKINFLGCLQDRISHKQALCHYLERECHKICDICKERKDKNTLRIFDCKNEHCQNLYKKAPKLTDHLCETCKKEWEELQETLQILGVSFIQDPFLVRGLDYYNKTVFEFSSNQLGAQTAFCGGGRYSLGKELDQKEDFPSIGAGIGLGRLELLVEKNLSKLNIPDKPALNLILPMGIEQLDLALLLSQELHNSNLCTDILFDKKSIKDLMKKANKMGAKFALIIGSDEQANNTISVKNMATGINEVVKQNELVNYLKFK